MPVNEPQTCLIIGSPLLSLINFRGPLIKDLIKHGVKVYASSNGNDPRIEKELEDMGVEYFPIRLNRAGGNLFQDIVSVFDVIRLLYRLKPSMVLSYTIKPNILIALASIVCVQTKIFTLIEGLGFMFMPAKTLSLKFISWSSKSLYKIILPLSHKVIFLNSDDLNQFVNEKYITKEKAVLVNGIGVDTTYYAQAIMPGKECLRFLMFSRLLRSKGVYTFIDAAREVRKNQFNVEFILAGDTDFHPDSIDQDEIKTWQSEGIIRYVGWLDDVRPLIKECHVVVLPSYYREGIPRTLLEAMSVGRPIITTDMPGCRETIETKDRATVVGKNGIMIPPKDVQALVLAMQWFIDHPQELDSMGDESRHYAQSRFDVEEINNLLLKELELG